MKPSRKKRKRRADLFKTLKRDVSAVFDRDPAARRGILGFIEILLCYPGFQAIVCHRVCHFLHNRLGLYFISRVLSHISRFITGIEIHPGACIGPGFFIDHGMGVVIGETTVTGENVTLYQGVTLGGTGKETGKRHPTLGNYVLVGAGAIVLGNITIGDSTVIGAGSVVVESVPPNCTVVGVPGKVVKREGEKVPMVHLDHRNLPDPIAERLSLIQKEISCIEEHITCRETNDCELKKLGKES